MSGNNFAVQRLGFSNGSKFSHIRNNWDKPGMVGLETWEVIEKYVSQSEDYTGIPTANLKKVWETVITSYSIHYTKLYENHTTKIHVFQNTQNDPGRT